MSSTTRSCSGGKTRRIRGVVPAACALICLLAFLLRAHRLGDLGLWYDEGWSAHLAQLTPLRALPEIMGSGHTHPPLYYLLLSAWQVLAGSTEFSIRFFSLSSGLLTVAGCYRLAYEMYQSTSTSRSKSKQSPYGQWIGLVAALSLALAPPQIVYSQEARSYSLFALEYMLLVLLSYRLLRRQLPFGLRDWVTLVLLELMALYTHYFALILLGFLGLVTFISLLSGIHPAPGRRWASLRSAGRLQRWAASQILVGLAYLPWVWTAIRQLGEHAPPDMQPLPLPAFLGLFWRFQLSGLSWAASHHARLVQATSALAVMTALSFVGNAMLRRMADRDWLVLASVLVPLGAMFAVEQVRPGIHPRYTLMLSAPLFLLLARQIGLWLTKSGAQRLAGVVLAGAVLLSLGLGLQAMALEHDKDDVRGLAEYLTSEVTARDLILFDYEDFAFQYYYRGQAPVLYLEGLGPANLISQRVIEEAERRDRAYLATWYTGHTDRRGLFPFLLELNGRLVSDRPFRGLGLSQYSLEPEMRFPNLAPTFADYELLQVTGSYWQPIVSSDGAIAVALRWHLTEPVSARYKVAVILKDGFGRQVTSVDNLLVDERGRPTEEWLPGTNTENYYLVPLPLGTPPLPHALHVALYAVDEMGGLAIPLDLLSEAGAPSGKHFHLGLVEVNAYRPPQRDSYSTRAQLGLNPVGKQAAEGLVLDAALVDGSSARPGDPLLVTLLWRSTVIGLPDYRPALLLTSDDQSGNTQILAQQQGAPADGRYPTTRWRKGELLLDRRELLIGLQAPPGQGIVQVQVGEREPLVLGGITIESAKHLYQLPAIQHTVYARFGEVAELIGYDLPIARTTPYAEVPITLYWRAANNEPLATGLAVFAHLLSEDLARLVAQHDGPPVGGQRPTTSWLHGEIIVDPHLLTWREEYEGICPVEVGLYDPASGERVPVYDREGARMQGDRVLLGQAVHSALGTQSR